LTPADEDPSNRLAPLEMQLQWLRDIGFDDVDGGWKWLELALLVGVRPGPP
jgi:tRNA (cmo5U34)-methyltransferase